MTPDLWGYALTVLGTLGTVGVGAGTVAAARRTVKATEKRDAHARDDAMIARYREGWTFSDARAEKLEQRVDEYRKEQEKLREDVDALRTEVGSLRRWMDRLVAYILDLLDWAGRVSHPTPHPPIPDDIAHLIDTQDKP